ncbi:MAG: 2-amino-4-hydroxy-6-hydroxymethyldihydropteridine diphosphokinase [Mariniphaga sp.]|nr:2-amino-4-hydroxy-6-hydroxymethyldihydropteridine diphosphokinase [Mariniphaga sp.]
MHKIYLGIGGNKGNKIENFNKVYACLEQYIGKIVNRSSIYETPPWGFYAKENFWNQVLLLETDLEPSAVLAAIGKIEKGFERKRIPGRYTSREMDIDMLYFDDLILHTETLKIPHPLVDKRLFVLAPLAEMAPEFRHPLLNKTNRQLLAACKDNSAIEKVSF